MLTSSLKVCLFGHTSLVAGVRPRSKVVAGVRPRSKVAGDCTLAPDPKPAGPREHKGSETKEHKGACNTRVRGTMCKICVLTLTDTNCRGVEDRNICHFALWNEIIVVPLQKKRQKWVRR